MMQNSNAYEEKTAIPDGGQVQPTGPPPGYQYANQANVPVQHVIVRQPPLTDPPKDYMVEAILVTICCFWPTGIVAIIKAMDVQRASNMGDRHSAEIDSAAARKFVKISLGLGIAASLLVLVLFALYVMLLVQRATNMGDRQMADINSAAARKFVKISLWVGIAATLVGFILIAFYVLLLLTFVA